MVLYGCHGLCGKIPILCKMIGREDLITDPRFATLKEAQANKRGLISIFDA